MVRLTIWNKMIVRAFYRQQAGFFLFIFLVFFGIVQPSAQLYFHYALIRGMLEVPAFMLLVALAWLLYAFRVRRFVIGVLEDPDAIFLYKINAGPRVLWLCLAIQTLLFLPVVGYALLVAGVAIARKANTQALAVPGYALLLLLVAALDMRYRLRYPGSRESAGRSRPRQKALPYWSILLRYVLAENKGILAAVKIFGCGLLYLLLRLQTPGDYDLRMPFLAYSLALFGHGILFYRCRELETTRLLCYRSLPVPDTRRFGQYALFCLLLLAPETMVLGWLTPQPIHIADGVIFALVGYGILLVLEGILITWSLTMADYFKLCLVLYGILYCAALKLWG